jgi:O-antigen/teichoic acid export membrane protein
MTLGVQAFRYAAEPFFFSKAADKDSPETFARVNHYFVIVASAVFLGVSLNLDLLKYLLRNADYWAGLSVVPVLLLANLFLGVYYNFSIWYKLTDRTHYGTWITAGGAVLTILLNYLLIPVAGYQGSSYVTLLCYFLMAASCYLLGQKHYPIPYTIIKDGALLLLAIGLLALSAQFTFPSLWLSALVHNGVLGAYLALAFWLSRNPQEV